MTELQATIDPVLIPIKLDSEIPEWACIELNGELLVPKDTLKNGKENPVENTMIPSESFELGSVRFVNKEPVMVCGTHELKGSVETLKQPFCVLQKESLGEDQTAYSIKGVVTQKVLFNKYPKTIMR